MERISIQYMKSGVYVVLVLKESDGTVKTNPREPASLTSRVTIKDNATFVIRSFTNSDSTKYLCSLEPESGINVATDPVTIVVFGKCTVVGAIIPAIKKSCTVGLSCRSPA